LWYCGTKSIVLFQQKCLTRKSATGGEDIARFVGTYGDYGSYDYYYDAEGRKKKKHKGHKGNKHHHHSNYDNHHHSHDSHHHHQAAWHDSMSHDHFHYGKGYSFDLDLIGNGRFCWNCYARLHYDHHTGTTTTAYDNCFGGIHDGFMEMCVGEEYYCSWEERRYKGVIVAVSGGCKSAHSCLRQMTENFRWTVYTAGSPQLTGNLCKSGNFGDETLNSVCAWCCDGMPSNLDRYHPANEMLCNHKDFTHGPAVSPAHEYFSHGDTDGFVWNKAHGDLSLNEHNDLFNGLYQNGQYHGLFRIHDHYPLGGGIHGPASSDKLRSHPREWTGFHPRGPSLFGQ